MDIYTPSYLYIKRHSVTGKLYFGMTKKDPEKYLGSGLHWKRHITTHGIEHVETLWYCLFLDQESISEFAINFSNQQSIVESEDWLNMMIETGVHMKGALGMRHSEETRMKISASQIGKVGHRQTEEVRLKIKESNIGKNKGKVHSEESRMNMSESRRKPQRRVECPHCGKIGGVNRMGQSHFDKCKAKEKGEQVALSSAATL